MNDEREELDRLRRELEEALAEEADAASRASLLQDEIARLEDALEEDPSCRVCGALMAMNCSIPNCPHQPQRDRGSDPLGGGVMRPERTFSVGGDQGYDDDYDPRG